MQMTHLDRPPEGSATPQGQPTITNMVQEELEEFGQHVPRRTKVVNRLIFIQIALLIMTTPLAFWPSLQPGALAIIVVGLVLFGATLARNQARRIEQAQLLLILGSGTVTALNVVGQYFWQSDHVLAVGLASFPFLLTIIEAGLLFVPERVLLLGIATTSFTTVMLALALLSPDATTTTNSQAYLLAVMSLGLQALTAMLAWQVARFILEFSSEVAQARREEFIATQFEAFRRGTEEQAYRLREQVTQLAQAIVRLSARDYTVRVNLGESELKPVADVLNVLSAELGSIIQRQQVNTTDTDTLRRIAEAADSIARGDIMALATPPNPTMTPTGNLLQGTLLTLQRARAAMQHRLGHVRDLSIDVGQRLNQVDERASAANELVSENRATVGHLRGSAETIGTTIGRLKQITDSALLALSDLLPPEVRAQSHINTGEPPSAQVLRPALGITVQLDAIDDETQLGPDDVASPAAAPVGVLADAAVQAKLREVWRLIIDITEETGTQDRETQVLQDRLGLSSRSLRNLSDQLVQVHQAVAMVRAIAQQVYSEASSTNSQPLATPLPDVLTTSPMSPGTINASTLLGGGFESQTPTRRPSRPISTPPPLPAVPPDVVDPDQAGA